MKKKYEFTICETNYGSIIVEANSVEEGREKAVEYWDNGDVEWGDCDVQVEFYQEVKE